MKKLLLLGLVFLVILSSAFGVLDDAVLFTDFEDIDASYVYQDITGAEDLPNNGVTKSTVGCLYGSGCAEFDGSSYFETAFSDFSATTTAHTISVWVYLDTTSSVRNIIDVSPRNTYNIWNIHLYNTGTTYYDFDDTSGGSGRISKTYDGGTGSWVHWVFTTDASGNKIIYKNGASWLTGGSGAQSFAKSGITGLFGKYVTNLFDGKWDLLGIWERDLSSSEVSTLYNSGNGYNPYASAPTTPFFEVTAEDIDTSTSLSNITVTLSNGTTYTNTTGTIVTTPFNDSSLRNFTVSVPNYFSQTFTNYNTSADLQANLTKYPLITAYDVWSNASLAFNLTLSNGTTYSAGTTGIYLPFNESQTLVFNNSNYFSTSVTHTFSAPTGLNQSLIGAVARFIGTTIITNSTVNPANFTINGVKKGHNESFFITPGTYTVQFSAQGYYDKNLTFDITSKTNQTYTFGGIGGNIINVTATEFLTGGQITNFTVNVFNTQYSYNETYTTTSGQVSVAVVPNEWFFLTISALNYLSNSTNITPTTQVTNYAAILAKNNSLTFNFVDEQTLLALTNVSFELTSKTFGLTGDSNGNTFANLVLLPSEFYEFRYTKSGYTSRNYYFNIPHEQLIDANLTVYLLNESLATDFILTVTDQNGDAQPDLIASLLRRYVSNNNQTIYTVVEMMQPSVALQGATPFTGVANTVPYLFRISDQNGTVYFQGAGTTASSLETLYLIDASIFIQVNLRSSAFTTIKELSGLSVLSNVSKTTNTFWTSYSDSKANVEKGCLKIYINDTFYDENCLNQGSGVLSYTLPMTNGTRYTGVTEVTFESGAVVDVWAVDNDLRDGNPYDVFGAIGLFFVFVNIVFVSMAFAEKPIAAVLVGTISVVLGGIGFIGFAPVAVGMQILLLLVAIVLAIVMREE